MITTDLNPDNLGLVVLNSVIQILQQNGYMESFMKTFKTECLDQLILTSDEQLRYVVKEYLLYYNHERPHSGLGGKMIDPWPQDEDGEIVMFSRLGGLLKSYRKVRQAA